MQFIDIPHEKNSNEPRLVFVINTRSCSAADAEKNLMDLMSVYKKDIVFDNDSLNIYTPLDIQYILPNQIT